MNRRLTAVMAVAIVLAYVGTGYANLLTAPDYSTLDGVWEGWVGGETAPSSFVTALAGVATVTPPSATEANFYQSFGAGPAANPPLLIGQAYDFSITSDNSSLDVGTTDAVMFVKAFDGFWNFIGAEFQTVPLAMDGSTQTISFTPEAGAFYQVGTFTIGTTSGSYDLSNPTLIAIPEPATVGLFGIAGLLMYARRRLLKH
jgi:hypothetical protein